MKKLKLSALLFSIVILTSACGLYPGGTTTTTTSASSSSNLSAVPTSTFAVQTFAPGSGTISTIPTTIKVTFNETTLNISTVLRTSNWSFACSGLTAVAPTNVTLSNGTATLTLPPLTQSLAQMTCMLTASANIFDTSGQSLGGTVSATYLVGTATNPFTLAFTAPRALDRLFGTVLLKATLNPTNSQTFRASSVTYSLDSTTVGTASMAGDGSYYFYLQTQSYANGLHTINVSVKDSGNNNYTNAASLSINIQNIYVYNTLTAVGADTGYGFAAVAPSGYVLFGLRVAYNSTEVHSIEPIWGTAYGANPQIVYSGSYYGGFLGSYTDLLCPTATSTQSTFAVSGFFGTTGPNLNSIGLICRQSYDFATQTKIAAVGNTTGTAFNNECKSNTFVTVFSGKANTVFNQLVGECN
jgi:hypothetical protein